MGILSTDDPRILVLWFIATLMYFPIFGGLYLAGLLENKVVRFAAVLLAIIAIVGVAAWVIFLFVSVALG